MSLLRALYLQRLIRLDIHLLWGASGKSSHFIYLDAQNVLINSASNSKGLSSPELTILTETTIAVGFSISLSAHFCFIPPPTHLPTSGVLIPRAVLKRMLLNKFLLTTDFQGNKSPTLPTPNLSQLCFKGDITTIACQDRPLFPLSMTNNVHLLWGASPGKSSHFVYLDFHCQLWISFQLLYHYPYF